MRGIFIVSSQQCSLLRNVGARQALSVCIKLEEKVIRPSSASHLKASKSRRAWASRAIAARMGGVIADWRLRIPQASPPSEQRSAFRSFFVFFFHHPSSHLAGVIAPSFSSTRGIGRLADIVRRADRFLSGSRPPPLATHAAVNRPKKFKRNAFLRVECINE